MKRNLLNTACKLEYNKDLITKYCCYKSPLLLYKPFELRPLSDMTCQLGIFFLTFALIHFFFNNSNENLYYKTSIKILFTINLLLQKI